MKREKTPEEKARSKRANANAMIAVGAVTVACASAGFWILTSGRRDAPDWMFGGRRAARAVAGSWVLRPSAVGFEDWGPEPFVRAKKEGKLVLLFLGPSYNAPTARMASETFGDAEVGALVKARFVPVRVKSEDWPDLDRRYRAGAWPTVAALLPDGVVLDAGSAMAPDLFRRWAGAIADKAAAHPELTARADEEAAARRRAAAADRFRGAAPPPVAAVDQRALDALRLSWDPARRTFDRSGPRFPRFERIAALRGLRAGWAPSLAEEAAKGALIFRDPVDGGFVRSANPDGTPAAREIVASDQAASLEALCGLLPGAARKELRFLDGSFSSAGPWWRGWDAGWAATVGGDLASDGPAFERLSRKGRPWGAASLGESADLSRAVLDCAEASAAQKTKARRILARARAEFDSRVRSRDLRLLLDDAVPLGEALLADGDARGALVVWRWIETNLADGPEYVDRLPTGVLPPELDRLPDAALNGRALRFSRKLAAALPAGGDAVAASKRAEALFFWLSARPETLDAAVWARLVAEEPR